MFKYELKRLLKSRLFLILILITVAYRGFITVNFFKNYNESIVYDKETAVQINAFLKDAESKQSDRESLRMAVKNAYLEVQEKAATDSDIRNTPGSYGKNLLEDWTIVEAANERAEYILKTYPEQMRKNVSQAALTVNDISQDAYTVRKNQKIIDKYNVKKDFSLIDTSAADNWLVLTKSFDYFYVFLTFALFFLASEAFCSERTRSLEGLVFTSKKGRAKLFSSRFISLTVIAVFLTVIFTAADTVSALYIMGYRLVVEPIQILPDFIGCMANINILTFIILCNLLRFALLLLAISLAAVISPLLRNIFAVSLSGGLMLFTAFALNIYAKNYIVFDASNPFTGKIDMARYKLYERIRIFLPTCFSSPAAYFEKFDYFRLADFPVSRIAFCLSVTVGLFAVFTLFGFLRFGRPYRFLQKKMIRGKRNGTEI